MKNDYEQKIKNPIIITFLIFVNFLRDISICVISYTILDLISSDSKEVVNVIAFHERKEILKTLLDNRTISYYSFQEIRLMMHKMRATSLPNNLGI